MLLLEQFGFFDLRLTEIQPRDPDKIKGLHQERCWIVEGRQTHEVDKTIVWKQYSYTWPEFYLYRVRGVCDQRDNWSLFHKLASHPGGPNSVGHFAKHFQARPSDEELLDHIIELLKDYHKGKYRTYDRGVSLAPLAPPASVKKPVLQCPKIRVRH